MPDTNQRHYPTYHHPAFIPVCPIHRESMHEYARKSKIIHFRCQRTECKERGKSPIIQYVPSTGFCTHPSL